MTIEITEKKEEEKKPDVEDIKETLKEADEYEKLKERNDKWEAELTREQELKSKTALGGRATAGEPEESQEDKDKKEAAGYLSTYQ